MGNLPGHPVVRSNPYPYRDTPYTPCAAWQTLSPPPQHSGITKKLTPDRALSRHACRGLDRWQRSGQQDQQLKKKFMGGPSLDLGADRRGSGR